MVYRQPTGQSVQARDHRPRPLRARAATTGSAQQVKPEHGARAGHVARPGGPRGSPRPGRRPRPQREGARPSVPGAQRSQAARAVLPDPEAGGPEPFSPPLAARSATSRPRGASERSSSCREARHVATSEACLGHVGHFCHHTFSPAPHSSNQEYA